MFWVVVIGMAGMTAAVIALSLLRGGSGAVPRASDVQVYRDQLDEVERDLARGTLTEDEAGRVRTEVARRLLEADRAARDAVAPKAAPPAITRTMAAFCTLLVIGGGVGAYLWLGAPGYPDQPIQVRKDQAEMARENRPTQAEAEQQVAALTTPLPADPTYAKMMEQLRATVKKRPDDLRGHRLLAHNEAGLGRFNSAIAAQKRVIELLGDKATAGDHTDLAEYMILAAGGYVSPEAEAALTGALKLDSQFGAALYYAGLLYAQTGRPDLAFQIWREQLETGPDDAPWMAPIRSQIADLAGRAGVRYDIPAPKGPAIKGPSAEDVAAASEMTAEDRNAMIRSMVAGLADRLAHDGGPPEDWARLIGAYGVLGETDTAGKIYAEAKVTFAEDPAALATIRAAANRAGLPG